MDEVQSSHLNNERVEDVLWSSRVEVLGEKKAF
jgi:hypothetical protein